MSAEAKVGLLVVVVALLALGIAVFLSGALRELGAYRVTAQFADVQGLDEGSPVRFGGVGVGTVSEVRLAPHKDYPGKPVAVTMMIDGDTALHQSDTFDIKQGALVGDKYVCISRPAEVKGPRQRLNDGDVVAGGSASSAEVVMDEARALIASARVAVDSVNVVMANAQLQEDFQATVANLRDATDQAVVIAEKVVAVVDVLARAGTANEQRLAALMQNLIAASEGIETTTKRIEQMMRATPLPAQMAAAGENVRQASEDLAAIAAMARGRAEETTLDEDVEAAVADLREASGNLREMTASAAELAEDEQMREDLRATLTNVREATAALKSASEHAEDLVTDEDLNQDLRAAVHSLRQTAGASQETMQRAQRVMTDIEGTMAKVREAQQIVTDIDTRSRLQMRAANSDSLRADVALDFRPTPDSDMQWRVGLRDIGSAPRLDLQYCRTHGDDWWRAGLFGNELGVAYDWNYATRRGLEVELYNPDDLRLDLRWRMSVTDDYDALLGVERTLTHTDPFIGVRHEGEF